MSNEGGKLSFGFSKVIKKPNLLKNNSENIVETKKLQLIDSIEGTELKVLGKNADDDKPKDLIIPLTDEQKSRPISKLIESRRNQRKKNDGIKESKETNGDSQETTANKEETLEQRAAREILEDLQNNDNKVETKILELPIHPDELPLDGAKESTLDDYEKIPIADFGKALLRGMGWKDEKKDDKDDPTKFEIFVRPKGLGLGADKVVKKQKLLVNPAPNEVLEIKKTACVKILAGKHKNLYGTIEGFDDGGGRLIVKLAIGGLKVQINEFMVQPVAKQEFAKFSKILNSEKYDEYKNDQDKNSNQKITKQEKRSPSPKRCERTSSPSTSKARDRENCRSPEKRNHKSQKYLERDRSRERRRSRDRSPHYSKNDRRNYSPDSENDKTNNRKYNEKHRKSRSHDREKHKRRHSSSDSNSERYSSKKKSSKKSNKSKSRRYSSDEEKVHKKKYKRSKHHRDRS